MIVSLYHLPKTMKDLANNRIVNIYRDCKIKSVSGPFLKLFFIQFSQLFDRYQVHQIVMFTININLLTCLSVVQQTMNYSQCFILQSGFGARIVSCWYVIHVEWMVTSVASLLASTLFQENRNVMSWEIIKHQTICVFLQIDM